MYVEAQLVDANVLSITFNEDVKAADFKTGVTIKVNDKTVRISSAARQRSSKVVHYTLKDPIHPSDTITWAYNAGEGMIQNWSGDQLLSVSEKTITVSP